MRDTLQRGEFVVMAEIEPPKGVDTSKMQANAAKLKGLVDAVMIPEMSSSVMRMSSLGGAVVLRDKGLNPVMQICCRDRNRIALQADLLAASACGINSIVAVTGDDPRFGDHPQAQPVYDIDLTKLLEVIQKMQQGRDMAGVNLQGAPSFLVGSTVNTGLGGEALEEEIGSLETKARLGADFFISQPVFESTSLSAFCSQTGTDKKRIIPSVLLLKSLGMARYIHKNLSHIHIPEEILERIKKAADKERECIKVAAEVASDLKRDGFGGVLISTMGWEHKIPEILDAMRG